MVWLLLTSILPSSSRSHTQRFAKMTTISSGSTIYLFDLVVFAREGHLIWPGCVQDCSEPEHPRSHVKLLRDSHGIRKNHFWTAFVHTSGGCWVSEDRVVRFHPDMTHIMNGFSDGIFSNPQRHAFVIASAIFYHRRGVLARFGSKTKFAAPTHAEVNLLESLHARVIRTIPSALWPVIYKSEVSSEAKDRLRAVHRANRLWAEQDNESGTVEVEDSFETDSDTS